MFTRNAVKLLAVAIIASLPMKAVIAAQVISLHEAIRQAQQNDPWLHGNQLKQQAVVAKSIASGTFADPKVSLGLANMPIDSWDFNQEAMTQFKVGVSQMMPRGDSLAIKQSQLKLQASEFPLMRIDRSAKVEVMVSQMWLDAYLAQKSIKLIVQDKVLFEQMVDVAKASYSSAVGKTRQQDVIRAQLELVQLDDRLTVWQQQLETSLAQLSEWLFPYDANDDDSTRFAQQSVDFSVSEQLPAIRLTSAKLLKNYQHAQPELAKFLTDHPALQAIEIQQQASAKNIDLAKEKYKPQWGVNASYAYRGDANNGADRADFFSLGVTFDLPLFTDNKQDKEVEASVAQAGAVKTEKLLLLRKMMAQVDKEMRQLNRLSERQNIYSQQLLNQAHEQAEAALTAYTNDDGDFAEVVRARIAELNARISALKIDVDALKTAARLNYYFVSRPSETTAVSGE